MIVAEPYAQVGPPLLFSLEADGAAAALRVGGTLGAAELAHVIRACERLPDSVRALRVDLRAATLLDPHALDVLAVALGRWRLARRGVTHVTARHRFPRP